MPVAKVGSVREPVRVPAVALEITASGEARPTGCAVVRW